MRLLLSKDSRENLFNFLIKINNCNSLKELSNQIKMPLRTIQNWKYGERYIPEKFIPQGLKNSIEILDKQGDNWGKIKGGKNAYKIIIKKYGSEEIKKRQIHGGEKSAKEKIKKQEEILLDINNPMFLEFYGVLLGDGWLSKWNYKNKTITLIGISGNANLDRDFFLYLKKNIKILFNRNAYLKERPRYNSIELNFSHKSFLQKIHDQLGFPIGQKLNLEISEQIYNLGYEKMRYVIRGIFDTDGCVYFDKTPVGKPYPCISIKMKAPILIQQLSDMLLREGFKIRREEWKSVEQIKLKGKKQLTKWMKEIGSSNSRNLNKIARVAQFG